jgi:hypothetical protein
MGRYEANKSGQIVFEEDKLFLVLSGVAQVVAKPELASSIRSVPSESSQAVTEQAVAFDTIFGVQLDRNTLERRDAPIVPNSRAKERRLLWRKLWYSILIKYVALEQRNSAYFDSAQCRFREPSQISPT